ncbi:hypothetical protein OSTOST_12080 [Ostertagia ostertagi]
MEFSRMTRLLCSLALLPLLCLAVREQSIAVKGRLLCGEQPAANVRVKLWEEDSGQLSIQFPRECRSREVEK